MRGRLGKTGAVGALALLAVSTSAALAQTASTVLVPPGQEVAGKTPEDRLAESIEFQRRSISQTRAALARFESDVREARLGAVGLAGALTAGLAKRPSRDGVLRDLATVQERAGELSRSIDEDIGTSSPVEGATPGPDGELLREATKRVQAGQKRLRAMAAWSEHADTSGTVAVQQLNEFLYDAETRLRLKELELEILRRQNRSEASSSGAVEKNQGGKEGGTRKITADEAK